MSNFYNTLTPKNQFNFNLDIQNNLDLSKGYFISGSQGCGKTAIAINFAKNWIKSQKVQEDVETNYLKFIHFLDIVKTARTAFKDNNEGWLARTLMSDLKDWDLLVIDDLGTEKQTDFIQEMVYDLINFRYENLKQTVITSNFSLAEIGEKYHARIASRIAEMCELITPKNQTDKRL